MLCNIGQKGVIVCVCTRHALGKGIIRGHRNDLPRKGKRRGYFVFYFYLCTSAWGWGHDPHTVRPWHRESHGLYSSFLSNARSSSNRCKLHSFFSFSFGAIVACFCICILLSLLFILPHKKGTHRLGPVWITSLYDYFPRYRHFFER